VKGSANFMIGCVRILIVCTWVRLDSACCRSNEAAELSDITEIRQRLDLWTGTLHSRFKVAGTEVYVRTAVHPDFDLLAVSIESKDDPRSAFGGASGFSLQFAGNACG
jgi:hypothetical protein